MTVLKGPLQIVFNITNRCNLRCLHCFNRSEEKLKEKELTEKEVLELIEEISDIKPFNLKWSGCQDQI
ncbi:MAG: 4Fe-4S cluster-binding domain-containing protein [Candidatus Aminicenantes bacterium]|nr:4Fe-4S cluster-binding domain-containing protein [Candidatus Aminicenantes bacterium]